MSSTLLAVFGHYDSRGGTTGVPLAGRNREAVAAAIDEYNKAFGWKEDVESYLRDPSKWQWNPTELGSSPGEQDFLYVAELWYEGELPGGDLEDNGVVAVDSSTEPPFDGNDRGEWCGEQFELLIKLTLARPVQLEFVNLGHGRYEEQSKFEEHGDTGERDFDRHIAHKCKQINLRHQRRGFNKDLDFSDIYIKAPSWNDDAFGFIIGVF